ncbi:unnamed protein product [Durusdinium trenchii]|uniref:Uncharacterized protein n=1 Tax=Durusdinium trenchii TaxID=1381693 RepID=A0ABP0I976_9DINO
MPSFKAFADFQKKAKEDLSDRSKLDRARNRQELQVGMSVRVKGLQARPELNGLEGVLTFREEEKGRWKVELKNGGGAKLFKVHDSVHTERIGPGAWWRQDANLEAYLSDQDALNILKNPVSVAKEEQKASVQVERENRPSVPPVVEPSKAAEPLETDSRPKSFLERSRQVADTSSGVSAAAVAAAAAVAKGAKAGPRPGDDSDVSTALEDDEAFVRSIEQCLKECDVMWDDY